MTPARTLLLACLLTVSPAAARLLAQQPTDDAFILESHIWRNFQPTTGTPDTALTALIRVSRSDRRPLARGTRLEGAWLSSGAKRWSVSLRPDEATREGHALELLLRGGPHWPIGDPVDVIILLRDAEGRARRLQVRAQPIRRLD